MVSPSTTTARRSRALTGDSTCAVSDDTAVVNSSGSSVPAGAVTSRKRGLAGAGRACVLTLDGGAGFGLDVALDGAGAAGAGSGGTGAGSVTGAASGVELVVFCSVPAQPTARPEAKSATAIHWVLMMYILCPGEFKDRTVETAGPKRAVLAEKWPPTTTDLGDWRRFGAGSEPGRLLRHLIVSERLSI
jgi:hypothetical protein